jgi:RimJ/RimL family protein N-acetyltransferase
MILETERLMMRPITPDDLDWLIEMRTPAAVNKYLGGTKMQNPEALSKRMPFYLACQEKNGFGFSVMSLKDSGEQIGTSGLQPLEDTGDIEVGYNLSEAHWRKGLGYECARGWLKFGFETAGLDRIVAVAHPDNTGSWRIMEKCGMTYQRNEEHYGIDCVLYAITRDEFLQQSK